MVADTCGRAVVAARVAGSCTFDDPVAAVGDAGEADCVAAFTAVNAACNRHHALTRQVGLRQTCHRHGCCGTGFRVAFNIVDTLVDLVTHVHHVIADVGHALVNRLIGVIQLAAVDRIGRIRRYHACRHTLYLTGLVRAVADGNDAGDFVRGGSRTCFACHGFVVQAAVGVGFAFGRISRMDALGLGAVAEVDGVVDRGFDVAAQCVGVVGGYVVVVTDGVRAVAAYYGRVTDGAGVFAADDVTGTDGNGVLGVGFGTFTDGDGVSAFGGGLVADRRGVCAARAGMRFFTSQANLLLKLVVSKCVMGAAPLLPANRLAHVSSGVLPTGVTAPRPVTTTLFNSIEMKNIALRGVSNKRAGGIEKVVNKQIHVCIFRSSTA